MADMTASAQSFLQEKPLNPTQKSVFFFGGELSFSVAACVGPPSVGPWRQEALLFGGVVYSLPVTALTVSFSLFLFYTAPVLSSRRSSLDCFNGALLMVLFGVKAEA
ncbi:hypothetical protein HID58_092833 [Brassica napus]|uniref:Uncharacterized protein n=1 Tax=Brassica napus TaxID=3708 RepID=A0ABQ7XFU6_BRANA|nr:hypothetical protein HID58_090327 [Brassica napus]KAH0853845.1 hypothetical protein HID58_092833 [Brassica napus]